MRGWFIVAIVFSVIAALVLVITAFGSNGAPQQAAGAAIACALAIIPYVIARSAQVLTDNDIFYGLQLRRTESPAWKNVRSGQLLLLIAAAEGVQVSNAQGVLGMAETGSQTDDLFVLLSGETPINAVAHIVTAAGMSISCRVAKTLR